MSILYDPTFSPFLAYHLNSFLFIFFTFLVVALEFIKHIYN